MKNGMIVNVWGDKRWYKDGLVHREDGPAYERANGDKMWYQNGIFHREDGPAVEDVNGNKSWFKNGVRHRIDGPAVEHANGGKEWFVNGELHREDGPAIERANGNKMWYQNGKFHREDGPAVEDVNGNKSWFKNGVRHREDGPAREFADGDMLWYQNGKCHREDGPAVEWADGSMEWWLNSVKVTEQIVMRPETITLEQISEKKDVEVRSIMIERYGWLRYIQDSKAKLLDSRDNAIENTKEALFAAGELGNRLVVTCPTGRVFALSVPSVIKTCEEAQQWLGKANKKINVIGRT